MKENKNRDVEKSLTPKRPKTSIFEKLKKAFSSKDEENEPLNNKKSQHRTEKAPRSSLEIGVSAPIRESDKLSMRADNRNEAPSEIVFDEDDELPICNEHYKRVSGRYRGAKYICTVILVIFLVVIYLIFKDSVTVENLKYMIRNLDSGTGESFGEETVILYDADPENSFIKYKNLLCVIDEKGVCSYSATGKKTLSQTLGYGKSLCKSSEKYLLISAYGAEEYSLYNEFDCVYLSKAPFSIYLADISNSGYYALAGKSNDFAGVITVYNENFKIVNKIQKSKYISSLDLDAQGRYLLFSAISLNKDGEFTSEITLLECGKTSEKLRFSIEGEYVQSVSFLSNGGFVLVSDKRIRFYDSVGNVVKNLALGDTNMVKYFTDSDLTMLFYRHESDDRKLSAVIYDISGNQIGEFDTQSSVKSIDINENYIALLTEDSILRYSIKSGEIDLAQADGSEKCVIFFQDRLLVCSSDSAATEEFKQTNGNKMKEKMK